MSTLRAVIQSRSGLGLWIGLSLLLLFSLASFTAEPETVFGPEQFVRGAGAPQRITRTFALPPQAGSQCTLTVQNGDSSKTRVTSATLQLNGAVVVSPADFKRTVTRIDKPVSLQPQNTLIVELNGKPGSFIRASVVCPVSGNTPPVANAGPDQTVPIQSTVQLDGGASRDPDGNPLSYRWSLRTKPSGSRAVLNSPQTAKPTFVADVAGEYVAQLIVNDGRADSAPDRVEIKARVTANTRPVANAGPDQTTTVGTTVQLDGGGSSDADGDQLRYGWFLLSKPFHSRAVLRNRLSAKPTFVADRSGQYVAQLIVFDGRALSVPDRVTIRTGATTNTPPVANAGSDQTATVGTTVALDGSGSSDVDGNSLTYAWSLVSRPAGSTATLTGATTVNPTFVLDKAGTYGVQLLVNDGSANSAPDSVAISTRNTAPVAHAGPDQSAKVSAIVTLDGSGSSDVDGNALTYAWTLPSKPAGSAATLSNPTTVSPTFTLDQAGPYEAQLIVNDGQVNSAADRVTITTENSPPVANAGLDQSVALNAVVHLDGSGSTDVDGNALAYQWSLTSIPAGSGATLSDPFAPQPTFTADNPGQYVAQLIVFDGTVASAPDTVTISTLNTKPVAEAGPAQTVARNAVVYLDGSGSTDADGDPLTYQWALPTKPANSTATLSESAKIVVNPTFVADQAGAYAAQLIVNDGAIDSDPDTVIISTENSKPVANAAGPNQPPLTGTTVTLDGSASQDVDGDSLTYRWSFISRPDGSTASLSTTDPIKPTFVPDLAGPYVVQLIVNDGTVDSEPVTATVTVIEPPPTNRAPTITSTAITQTTAGQLYRYQVTATDPDAGDTLTYALPTKPDGMAIDAATGLIQWTPSQAGGTNVVVRVTDGGGLFNEQSFTITVAAASTNQAPQVNAGTPQTITLPANQVTLSGTVTDDSLPNPPNSVTVTWTKDSGPGTVTFGSANAKTTTATFSAAGAYVLRLTASDGALSAFATVTITVNPAGGTPPPDPATVAPPPDPTVATTTYAATQFLYSGANPIQTGVASGTIDPKRTAVLRGRVLDKSNAPLSGVTMTILGHPEFGQTLSRADGMFDLAVNGGGLLTVVYTRGGYLPAQRQEAVPWQDFVVVEDTILIARDTQATVVDLTQSAVQVAQGSPVTDQDGTRQATLLIPPGTTAQVYNPDGSTRTVSSLTLRATEYTVGANGPKTMPAPLPPTSGYTYAVEISTDEATTKLNGKDVLFNQPVPFYVDNFLNFPVGGAVPVGYYDNTQGAWIPAPNGRIIKILSISNGKADLDVTGSGTAADAAALTALGITDAERTQLANLYPVVGKSLWRVPLAHLSTWDCNWPFGPPADAQGPTVPPPDNDDGQNPPNPVRQCGSIIECENQTLGEHIPVAGTGFSLNYRSDRVPGRVSSSTLVIPLGDGSVPASLKRIDLAIAIAGRVIERSFDRNATQTRFTWDGKDGYGRSLSGSQTARVTLSYAYDGAYQQPASGASSFGRTSGVPFTGDRARQEIYLSRSYTATVGAPSFAVQGIGGWTLDVHHVYDPNGKVVYRGDGGQQRAALSLNSVITTFAGGGGNCDLGENVPIAQACLMGQRVRDVAVTSDGSVLFGDGGSRIRRVGADGRVVTIADADDTYGYSGDGGPALQARFANIVSIVPAPDGSIVINDLGNRRIRRIGRDGIVTTIGGNGTSCYRSKNDSCGDGGPALQAGLASPYEIAVAADGSILISEAVRIRQIGPDGIITTIAGALPPAYNPTSNGDGGPATQAFFGGLGGMGIAPDNSIWVFDNGAAVGDSSSPTTLRYLRPSLRRIGPDGVITTVAGSGACAQDTAYPYKLPLFCGDGGLATQAGIGGQFWDAAPGSVAAMPNGSMLFTDSRNDRIRLVKPNGIITTITGSGVSGYYYSMEFAEGSPATQARLGLPTQVAVAPDGNIFFAVKNENAGMHLLKLSPPLTGFTGNELVVASEDGRQLYSFDASGRHLRTVDTLTGTTLYTFAYDSAGRLITITDADNNVTTLERDGNGKPTAIAGPFGQRTGLTLDTNGYLARVTNPAGEAFQMTYTSGGLLTQFTDPNGHASQISYDALGRLQRDADAAGGSQTLARTSIPNGFAATRTTALNRTTTYTVENLPIGDQKRSVTAPDGIKTETLTQTNGTVKTTAPDGTVTVAIQGPDPRFGMQAPITKSQTVTSGGLTSTLTTAVTADLTTPGDPLSLTTLIANTTLNGRLATSVYHAASRITTTTSAAGRVSYSVLDAKGRVSETGLTGLDAVHYSYDARGRLSNTTQGSGGTARTITLSYDAGGFLASTTDSLGRVTTFANDAVGRVLNQTLPDASAISFDYDANSNLTALTPPGRLAHDFTYTPVDLTAAYQPPTVTDGGNTQYEYNLDRQPVKVIRPDGGLITSDYDAGGRFSALTTPTGGYGYSYTAAGQLSGITAPGNLTLAFTHNQALLTGVIWSGAIAGQVGFGYDNDFRVAEITVDGANPIAYQYDADSLLTQAGALTLARSAENGLLTGSSLDKVGDSYTYNSFGEITRYTATYDVATPRLAVQYTYDQGGRITQKVETVAGSAATTYDYGYDPLGQLIEVKRDHAVIARYSYDANGNRLSTTSGGTVNATYDAQDRLLTYGNANYAYTANGELQRKTVGALVTTYSYDALGNLRNVTLPGGTAIEYLILLCQIETQPIDFAKIHIK
jgi:YD repeat-containing protein